jgi:hypothetical protein
MGEATFRRDSEWSRIDNELCLVKSFDPRATVGANGRVVSVSKSEPYASITFECTGLSEHATGYITNRADFLHLWRAFNQRGVGDDEEVVVACNKSNLKPYAKLIRVFMPGLVVMICPKDAYRLMSDPSFRPELTGMERAHASLPLAEWKPDVMD